MISLHWHLTPRLKFLYVLHELLLLCGKYYILYNIRRSAFGAASSFELSEHGDEVFQSDSRQGEHPAPALSQDTPSQPNQPKQDLVDTFDLFKTYLDHKLHDLKSDIISEQENLSLKVKEQVNLKFKSEGNKILLGVGPPFANTSKIKLRTTQTTKKEFARLKTEPLNILRIEERFTLPRIVDIQHPLDQKLVLIQILIMCAVLLLSRPFVSALHGVSRAPGMCVSTVKVWDIGEKTVRSSTEPARIQLQQHILNEAPNLSADTVNDKYFIDCNFFNCYENNVTEFEIFSEQVNYFENSKLHGSFKGVKGNLKKHIQYWKDIGANEFILGTISEGYVIPFSNNPPSMCFKNNRSAFQNHDFVDTAIAELVDNGCAIKVPFKPYVVSPLSVATQKSGKKRLILDLSVLNKFVRKDKFKYEDWKVAIQLFGQNCYMYKFDLKSGYHHFDICTKQQTYLGFSWKGNFYCFTVLPFGLLSSPFLFTKCLRTMVKYWRSKAVNIVLNLDDGLGMSLDYDSCFKDSFFIRKSLTEAGFLINVDKSVFTPAQSIEWLGIIWDSVNFSLQIPDRRVQDLIESVSLILSEFPLITARNLAQVTGKIISMSPVIGNISRLMTRYCYMIIETRSAWDSLLEIIHSDQVKAELVFWQENIVKLNRKYLAGYSCSSVVIYSDASDIAAGACTVELKSKNFHTMWNSVEKVQSSTWREMKAIELALSSGSRGTIFKPAELHALCIISI